MAPDLAVDLINATVQLEQPLGNGTRTVGTGFLVSAPTPDGKPRTVLITSAHVFDRMPQIEARVGWRVGSETTDWRYAPAAVAIRNLGAGALWTRHPTQDVAALTIVAPPAFAKAAIPLAWLADDSTFAKHGVQPGDEMMALGFPKGLSSNRAGFPILRWGRVASYPLGPVSRFPNFLLDFRVFDGNSGGPVFMADPRRGEGASEAFFVAGVLTKQVESKGDRLEIGVVTHAKHVRETIALLDRPMIAPPPKPVVAVAPKPVGVQPATTTTNAVSQTP